MRPLSILVVALAAALTTQPSWAQSTQKVIRLTPAEMRQGRAIITPILRRESGGEEPLIVDMWASSNPDHPGAWPRLCGVANFNASHRSGFFFYDPVINVAMIDKDYATMEELGCVEKLIIPK